MVKKITKMAISYADEELEAHLAAIEQEHDVVILYACESGSRAWGFESPDSDYDVRFIYVHKLDWYLTVSPQRDVIELPINDDLDINGWELRKALGLLKKGNATLVEWLKSPIVYQKNSYFIWWMRRAIEATYQPERAFHHYLHMAQRNYREYLQGEQVRFKKYLYVLRPMLAATWVEQYKSSAPMLFDHLVNDLVKDDSLKQAINDLLEIKRSVSEAEYGEKIPLLNHFIDVELTRLKSVVIDDTTPNFTILDELLNDIVVKFTEMRLKNTSLIPKGQYCDALRVSRRQETDLCPYWQLTEYGMVRCNYMNIENLNEYDITHSLNLAIAHYGSEDAFRKANLSTSYIHDEQKFCDVNWDWDNEL